MRTFRLIGAADKFSSGGLESDRQRYVPKLDGQRLGAPYSPEISLEFKVKLGVMIF